jgi:toxin-antitoxin system PIN domain toxin
VILLDVNVLVAAHRADHHAFKIARPFVATLVHGRDMFGVPQIVLQSVVRIVTLPIFAGTLQEVLLFCEMIQLSPACRIIHPTATHWETFTRLCLGAGAKGNVVAGAYLAAFAVDRDDEWVTLDRDFARFPGLRWRLLGDPKPTINPA